MQCNEAQGCIGFLLICWLLAVPAVISHHSRVDLYSVPAEPSPYPLTPRTTRGLTYTRYPPNPHPTYPSHHPRVDLHSVPA